MDKCLLRVMGKEAKDACGTEQHASGAESKIEGGIHAIRLLSHQNSQEEDWEFLLIDAWNTLNEENWTSMIWAVRNEWPSGAQFTFNCYYHWANLVVHDTWDGSGHFLHIK